MINTKERAKVPKLYVILDKEFGDSAITPGKQRVDDFVMYQIMQIKTDRKIDDVLETVKKRAEQLFDSELEICVLSSQFSPYDVVVEVYKND